MVDYNYVFDRPILGGELGYRLQLHQPDAQRKPISTRSPRARSITAPARKPPIPRSRQPPTACCAAFRAPTAVSRPRRNGGAASPTSSARYSRRLLRCASTPARCRSITIRACRNFINTGDTNLVRAMPTVGLEYRYPFINVQSWGTQTVEPIAQMIVRPNEQANRPLAERRRAKLDVRR